MKSYTICHVKTITTLNLHLQPTQVWDQRSGSPKSEWRCQNNCDILFSTVIPFVTPFEEIFRLYNHVMDRMKTLTKQIILSLLSTLQLVRSGRKILRLISNAIYHAVCLRTYTYYNWLLNYWRKIANEPTTYGASMFFFLLSFSLFSDCHSPNLLWDIVKDRFAKHYMSNRNCNQTI